MDSSLNLLGSTSQIIYGIDAWIPNFEKKTGVQNYTFQLIQAMKKYALSSGERVVLYSYLPFPIEFDQMPNGWESKVLSWPLKRGWMSARVSYEMLRNPPSVLFVPGQAIPRVLPKAVVTTIHDIAFAKMPELYDSAVRRRIHNATKRAIKHSTRILVPSIATKQDLIDVYQVSPERIVVTPLAPVVSGVDFEDSRANVSEVLRRYRLGANLLLTIGRLEKKKNISTLIRGFESFKSRRGVGDPFELVLIGEPGYRYDEIKKMIDLSPCKNQIRELGFVPDNEARAILSVSTAYLFPSWYEGFGIPNLDAMSAGVALITSDIPPHREVVGDAGVFVSPSEPESWARAIERIVHDVALREDLIRKGKQRAIAFSWDQTAKITFDVLRSVV